MRLQPGDPIVGCEVVRFVGISDDNASLYLVARGSERFLVARYEMLEDDSYVRMRFDEATYLTSIKHPLIQRIRAIGREHGRYICVLEYVPGADLGSVVRTARSRGIQVGFDVAVAAVMAVAQALHYLHDASSENGTPLQIVHRDVTAWNVLVGEDGRVKLTLASLMRVSPRAAGGKQLWLSPEQVRGRPLDRRSDLFQLGILLYELTTARFPFPGDTEMEVYQQIVGVDVEPPSRRSPGCPDGLERTVLRLLARDPDARHQTARELVEDLVRIATELHLDVSPAPLATLVAATTVAAR